MDISKSMEKFLRQYSEGTETWIYHKEQFLSIFFLTYKVLVSQYDPFFYVKGLKKCQA